MQVHWTSAGHLLTFSGKPESEPIIDWVRVRYGGPGRHEITFGKDWKQAPEPL